MTIPKEERIIVENMHEPLIDKETFDIVQDMIKSRTSTRVKSYDWLLKGILTCKECGKKLIIKEYTGEYKELLLYLTPIIFENNPAQYCKYKCNENVRNKVPERRKMDPKSEYGMAIGNLTAQAASNFNLSDFDNYVINELNMKKYVRYVDDIVIVSDNKNKLVEILPFISRKLDETHQKLNQKKTKIDTAFHGVKFLGKISYPYGYQKPTKQVIIRVCNKSKNMKYTSNESLLAKTNAQIGVLKNYNCRRLILNYFKLLPDETKKIIKFNDIEYKFQLY